MAVKAKTAKAAVNRDNLIQHLARIGCSGQIEGAVFSGAFKTRAISPDMLVAVEAPELPGILTLPEEVGVPWLDQLSSGLKVLAGDESGDVAIRMENHRLIIDEGKEGKLRLLLSAPKTIGTYINEETWAKLAPALPVDAPAILLPANLRAHIIDTFGLFKATEMTLTFGPNGGAIKVGNENANQYDLDEGACLIADVENTMLFGEHVVAVLRTMSPSDEVILRHRAGCPLLAQAAGYTYVLAPKTRGADA